MSTSVPAAPAAPAAPPAWTVRGRALPLARPLVMAVLNVTPDSFSDGGTAGTVAEALAHAGALVAQGADLLDVGGESTAPGRLPVDAATERARVVPVVEAIVARWPDVVVSVDTMKGEVARAALAAGAHVINDVTGGRHDPHLLDVVAAAGAGVVLMHSRGPAGALASYAHAHFDDVVADTVRELAARRDAARAAGIADGAIVLDPGIGFGKRTPDSLALLRALPAVGALGHPVLVGASRKRIVGDLTGVADPRGRVHGGVGLHLAAIVRGASLVRTHDVAATCQALDAAWPVLRAGA